MSLSHFFLILNSFLILSTLHSCFGCGNLWSLKQLAVHHISFRAFYVINDDIAHHRDQFHRVIRIQSKVGGIHWIVIFGHLSLSQNYTITTWTNRKLYCKPPLKFHCGMTTVDKSCPHNNLLHHAHFGDPSLRSTSKQQYVGVILSIFYWNVSYKWDMHCHSPIQSIKEDKSRKRKVALPHGMIDYLFVSKQNNPTQHQKFWH